MYFSMYTEPFEKAFSASPRATWNSLANETSLCAMRIPRPPPPADALIITGKPVFSTTLAAIAATVAAPVLAVYGIVTGGQEGWHAAALGALAAAAVVAVALVIWERRVANPLVALHVKVFP